MTSGSGSTTDLFRFWQRLGKSDKEIVLYFVYAPQPVSVDTLTSFSGVSAVAVLNLMDKLRRKRLVAEKKGFGRGVFFLRDSDLSEFIREQIADGELKGTARRIIDCCAQLSPDSEKKTLLLADLYTKLGYVTEGLELIKNAADILARSGEKSKAAALYDQVIRSYSDQAGPTHLPELFLDSVIGQIRIMMHRMPLNEPVPYL